MAGLALFTLVWDASVSQILTVLLAKMRKPLGEIGITGAFWLQKLVPRSRVELLTRGFSVRCSTT